MNDLRELVLDTETTGLEPGEHRIVEIGALELINHVPTGRTYHQYIQPRRPMPPEAEAIHGITDAFLADKPVFEDIADAFVEFMGDGILVIHNARFDVKFLNFELGRVDRPPIRFDRVVDTLEMARERFPGAQNSLDALCRRFRIDGTRRVKHGALLDSELLADVYLELIGGRQGRLSLDNALSRKGGSASDPAAPAQARGTPRPVLITEAERAAHERFLDSLGDGARWREHPGLKG